MDSEGHATVVEILQKLVSINSVSGNEAEISDYISGLLEQNNFIVEHQEVEPGRKNIFASKGRPGLLFFGHMDTVPLMGDWTRDPFRLTIEEDKAFGLGAWDMKGGIAAILDAAQHASDMAILLTVDEEEMSRGAWRAIENRDFFNGIEGIVSAEAGNEEGTFGGPTHLSYGRNGRKAFRLTKELPAGHAATTRQEWLEWVYSKIKSIPETRSRIVITALHVTSRGFSMPERVEMDIDVSIDIEDRGVDFESLVAEHFQADAELIKRDTPYLEPYSFKGHGFIERIAGIVEAEIGEPTYHVGRSVGDENAFATLGVPIVIVGPEGRNEHKADEWVSITSLEQTSRLYRAIVGPRQG